MRSVLQVVFHGREATSSFFSFRFIIKLFLSVAFESMLLMHLGSCLNGRNNLLVPPRSSWSNQRIYRKIGMWSLKWSWMIETHRLSVFPSHFLDAMVWALFHEQISFSFFANFFSSVFQHLCCLVTGWQVLLFGTMLGADHNPSPSVRWEIFPLPLLCYFWRLETFREYLIYVMKSK